MLISSLLEVLLDLSMTYLDTELGSFMGKLGLGVELGWLEGLIFAIVHYIIIIIEVFKFVSNGA